MPFADYLTDAITWVFIAANSGRILAYGPQLVAAWNCKSGAASISRATWGYFAFAHFTGIVYALVVVQKQEMALVFTGNFVVCCLLVVVVTWKKHEHRCANDGRVVKR
jgi:hypothetical protein